jgi:uncharacterized membrane protein
MRQLGSVLGIAVMGAVLQNQAVLNIQQSVAAKLAPLSFLPEAAKAAIVKSAGQAMTKMGEMGGSSGALPSARQASSANGERRTSRPRASARGQNSAAEVRAAQSDR